MTFDLPPVNREVRLAARPKGLPRAEDLEIVDVALGEPEPGQLLVRNREFLVFSSLRTLLGGGARNTPLPGLNPGDALFGPAVGEVVRGDPDGGGFKPGDLVAHFHGWRDYAVVAAGECTPVDPALPEPAVRLSSGSAGYGALTRIAEVREGDVVLVTGAAGGVGSLAGQVARLLGAAKVIGTTGSPWKAARLREELGYDEVLTAGSWRDGADRRAAYDDFAAKLAQAAPDGIDVLLDNVGGVQLAAAVDAARHGARFALVGSLSGQLAPDGTGGTAPAELDAYRLILKGVTLRGYLGTDYPDVEAEWTARFAQWLRDGDIRYPVTRFTGIESAPRALQEMVEGRQFGTVLVELAT